MSDDPNAPVPRNKVAQAIEKIDALEKQVAELNKFCKDLLTALLEAEKSNKNLFLLPQGVYFGKSIE